MEAVFARVLEISRSGSVIVLVVLALRLLLRRAPKRAVCLLWMIAVLRLLVPLEIESNWSLQPEPVEVAPPQRVEYFDSGPVTQTVPPELLEDAVEYPLPERPRQEEPVDILPWLWLAGVAALGLYGVAGYLRLRVRVRGAVILEEGVWISPGLDTAFVLGFFRPRVYLPVLSQEERELVLLHERTHIRRLDHWWKIAAYAAVSLHWFNPLAWVTYGLLCRDMEMACDQETVKGMDRAQRRAYSAALLRCAARGSGIAACPVAFGEISVKERIKMVLNYKKPGFWVTLVALIAAVAVGVCLLTSPKELTDLDRCEQALKEWQEMEVYELQESGAYVGDYALNDWSRSTYLSLDGEYLMRYEYGDGLGRWRHWKDGRAYSHEIGSLDADWEDSGWQEDRFSKSDIIPWAMRLQWDELVIHHVESADDGKTVLLTVDQSEWGPGTMSFHFADDGKLRSISRTYTLGDDEGLSSVCTNTVELKDRDRADIEKRFEQHGVVSELVWLYRELEELQNAESVHLVIDMEMDSNYDGWDTCREEYLKSDRIWSWNFDYQSSSGPFTTSYLWYGAKLYATEYSDAGVVPNRPWAEIGDTGSSEPPILTHDWTKFPVLDIQTELDGSAVITLQGDLTPTEDTTYYEKTYELHLDPAHQLTTLVVDGHYSKTISEQGDQGSFEIRGKDTIHILDTPAEEIRERIMAIKSDAIG